jgi:methionine synthase I (cobalamin-dependent)
LTIAGGVHRGDGGGCAELLNITHPKQVAAQHERLLRSGARLIFTNTSGAAPQILDRYRMHDEAFAVSYLAAEIACRVARDAGEKGDRPLVIGDIRVPWHMPAHGYLTGAEIEESAASMTTAQITGGVDLIHLQATGFPGHMAAAFAGVRAGMGEAGRGVSIVVSVAGGAGVPGEGEVSSAHDLVAAAVLAHGLGAAALSIDTREDDEENSRCLSALAASVDALLFVTPGASERVAQRCLSNPAIGPRLAFVGADTPAQAWRLSRFAAPPHVGYSCPIAFNQNDLLPSIPPAARSGNAR